MFVCDFSDRDSRHAEVASIPSAVMSACNDDTSKLSGEHDSFCDFVQFEDTSGDEESLMQKCVRNYLKLFAKFVDASVSRNSELFISQLRSSHNCTGVGGDVIEELGTGVDRICPTKGNKDIVEGFTIACQLLIDLSSIPVGLSSTTATSSGVPGRCCFSLAYLPAVQ